MYLTTRFTTYDFFPFFQRNFTTDTYDTLIHTSNLAHLSRKAATSICPTYSQPSLYTSLTSFQMNMVQLSHYINSLQYNQGLRDATV